MKEKAGEVKRCNRDNRSMGKSGEDVAVAYLEKSGLKFVARNWYSGHLELDIIMEDDSFIHFVEVRSLMFPNVIEPFETIDVRKRKRIIKSAGAFIGKYGVKKEVVFDVVSVVFFKNGNFKIEYIANAFTPVW